MAVFGGRQVTTGRAGMDITSGTSDTNVSQKEDLANFISMITRDETPFMSSIGKTKATAIYHEWQTDELAKPGNSRIGEGTDYVVPTGYTIDGSTGEPTGTHVDGLGTLNANQDVGVAYAHTGPDRTRLGNYTQINGKAIAISGTRRVIDQAGVADEYAYQLKKRGTELRRDLESDLIHNYQPATTTGNARKMGGFQSWINNPLTVEFNDAVAPAVTTRGAGNMTADEAAAMLPAVADRVSLSLSSIDGVMQKIYEEGGKAGKIMLSPKLRRDFSDLMVTDSGVRRNIDMDGKLRQSVDIYMSDFGDLMVIPNYIMGLNNNANDAAFTAVNNTKDSCALVYDPMWFSIATLRPLQEVDVGQRGDSTIGMMIEECTFEVKNPIGCGAIYGLK